MSTLLDKCVRNDRVMSNMLKWRPGRDGVTRPLKHDEDFRISWNQGFI